MIALTKVRARQHLRAALLGPSCLVGSVPSAHAQLAGWTLAPAEKTTLGRAPRGRSATASRDTACAYRAFGYVPRAGNPVVDLRAISGNDLPAAPHSFMVGIMLDVAGSRAFWLRSQRVEALREAWLCRIALDRAIAGWEDRS